MNTNEIAQKVELICEDANVEGDVLPYSLIDTNTLNVNGTTHTDSMQFAKYARIDIHKGTLRCHEAIVNVLNSGEIHATTAKIDTAIAGSVYAQDIQINNITDNVNIYASNSIQIQTISGDNNNLYINYKKVPILVSKIDLIQDDIEELEFSLQKAQKDNSLLEKEINTEILRLTTELQKIKNSSKNAKISIKNRIKGSVTIHFNIDDENKIVYEAKDDLYTSFYLEYNKNIITLQPTQKTITLNS